MILYRKYNFAFQHINRSGGISVKDTTYMLLGEPDKESVWGPNIWHTRLDKRLSEVDVDNITIYANVRNPFDRVKSIYNYRKIRGHYKDISFEHFFYKIFIPGTAPQNDAQEVFCCIDDEQHSNVKVIKFSDINKAWPYIFKKHFNINLHTWPKMNYIKRRNKSNIRFTSEMIKLLLHKEKWAFENFYSELI